MKLGAYMYLYRTFGKLTTPFFFFFSPLDPAPFFIPFLLGNLDSCEQICWQEAELGDTGGTCWAWHSSAQTGEGLVTAVPCSGPPRLPTRILPGRWHSLLCSWGALLAALMLCIPTLMLLHFLLLQQVQNSGDKLSISITSKGSIYTRQANMPVLEFKVTGLISAWSSSFLRGGRLEASRRNSFTSRASTSTFVAEGTAVSPQPQQLAPKSPEGWYLS